MKTNPGVQCSEVTEHKEYIHHPHHVVIVDLQPDLSGLLSTSVNSAPQPAGCHEEHKTEHKKKPQKGYDFLFGPEQGMGGWDLNFLLI